MRGYRYYFLDITKRIRETRDLVCRDDNEAMATTQRAATQSRHHGIELWAGAKLMWFGRREDFIRRAVAGDDLPLVNYRTNASQ